MAHGVQSPFYRGRNTGSERVRSSPQITQPGRARCRLHQATPLPLCSRCPGPQQPAQVLSGGEVTDWREERVTEYLLPISDGANQSTQLNLEHLKKSNKHKQQQKVMTNNQVKLDYFRADWLGRVGK